MLTRLLAFVAAVLFVVWLPGAAVGAGGPPQLNWEAAVLADNIPTADPCVTDQVMVDLGDFRIPTIPDVLFISAGRTNTCTGELLHSVGGSSLSLAEDEFVVSGRSTARLNLTVTLFEGVTQSDVPVSVDLRWDLKHSSPVDGEAVVTGQLTGPNFTTVLGPEISWNRWGSETFPWAGLWLCIFTPHDGLPGCIGQV